MKIFWSWQSDTHQPSGRHFVRSVLAELARDLNGLDGTEDAARPDAPDGNQEVLDDDGRVEVDHDTHGVGGSPLIAETILGKIRNAGIFVADVTPIAQTVAGKRVPNPNVMIELGYAMQVLDDQQIVLVMNGAEGAALKYLPFDLRHRRVPILFKLSRDSTEEQRVEVAKDLKAELSKRVVPGLRIAESRRRDDNRRTHRAPELSVTLQPENERPYRMAQSVGSLGVKTLDEIKNETPLLPLPKDRYNRSLTEVRSHSASSSMLFGLRETKPVSQWWRDETEGYNRFVDRYYLDYQKYLVEQADFIRLRQRSLKVTLVLQNAGTLAATDIDVDVTFPTGIVLYGEDDAFAARPKPPEAPPLRPMGTRVAFVTQNPLDIASLDPTRYLPRSTYVHPAERRVHFSLAELKHNHSALINSFMISFAEPEDIESFRAEYAITAREPIDPIRGYILFDVERDD